MNKEDLLLKDSLPKVFLFYDFESYIDISFDGKNMHKPNLCCSSVVCDYCWDKTTKKRNVLFCNFCGCEDKIFYGLFSVKDFLEYLFNDLNKRLEIKRKNMRLKNKIPIIVIAHNSRAYDIHFIIKHCLDNNYIPKNIIKKGSKVLSMYIKNIHFLDSLSFLQISLKCLPKMFGIEDTCKGRFQHKFNVPTNWNVVQRGLPSIEFYQPGMMKIDEREQFLNWYEQNKHNNFDFKTELIKYCETDVIILMKSVMSLRSLWQDIFKIDLLTRNVTLPMAVFEVFKANYLKSNVIAIIPVEGYDRKRKQSYVANSWLDFMQKSRENEILREYKLLNYFVDGFIPQTKECLEFWGCFFHGCNRCYSSNRHSIINPFNGLSMTDLYNKTQEKILRLKINGFKITSIWECELKILIKGDKQIKMFFDNHSRNYELSKYTPYLLPRDALYGGRTNAVKLFHSIENEEKIRYYDFTSLYPYVVKNGSYPIGHPKRLTEFKDVCIDNFNGLILCAVLPPKNLLYPILPTRCDNKLFFTLCFSCATDKQDNCTHEEKHRFLTGVWTTIELKRALNFGYKILKLFEVWTFDKMSDTGDEGIFGKFINDCIKGKIEASGWPNDTITIEEKNKFIEDYFIHENIRLDSDNIAINPGKRSTFKLVVNSFWGKFAQDSLKMKKTEFITSPESFFSMFSVLSSQ